MGTQRIKKNKTNDYTIGKSNFLNPLISSCLKTEKNVSCIFIYYLFFRKTVFWLVLVFSVVLPFLSGKSKKKICFFIFNDLNKTCNKKKKRKGHNKNYCEPQKKFWNINLCRFICTKLAKFKIELKNVICIFKKLFNWFKFYFQVNST